MNQSATPAIRFAVPVPLPLEASFDGGRLTSDGGLPWLGEAEAALGLCAAFAALHSRLAAWSGPPSAWPPWSASGCSRSPAATRTRTTPTRCARDPLLKPVCGRLPESGRRPGQPADACRGWRTRSIGTACYRLAVALGRALPARAGAGRRAARTSCSTSTAPTTRPTASRKAAAYHGYYRQHMYHPLLVFDGDDRPAHHRGAAPRHRPRQHRGGGGAEAGGGARCGRAGRGWRSRCGWTAAARCRRSTPSASRRAITYTIGLVPNRAAGGAGGAAGRARPSGSGPRPAPRRCGCSARPPTRPGAGRTRGGWSSRRRRWPKAPTPASSSPPGPIRPQALYDWYVDRGEPENWIKDLKNACFADRLSDHRFWANQFRLLLHAAAYWLLDTLRRWLMQRAGAAAATGHAAPAAAEDRRPGLAAARSGPPALGVQSSRATPLAPLGRSRPLRE